MKTIRTIWLVGIFLLGMGLCGAESKLAKVRLGSNINSPTRECSPIISPDGLTLYFVRQDYADPDVVKMLEKMPDAKDEKAVQEYLKKLAAAASPDRMPVSRQSSWYSQRLPDGSWDKARLLPPPLNNNIGSYILGALPDNNTLFMGLLKDPIKGFYDGRDIIGLTTRTKTGWSDVRYFVINGYSNTSIYIHFALAPDNRVLLLALQNSESLGNMDIYVSFIQPDGSWSRPKNLGPKVNSPSFELGLAIAPDDATVYFASDRPAGFGGTDIYMMRRLDDSWLNWTTPQNLGPEINDSENQDILTVDASGNYAFIVEGPQKREDIFQFSLPEAMRPKPVVFVRGVVSDPDKKPLAAGIGYERLRDSAAVGAANSDPKSGRYQIALPLGENYGFSAGAPGYYSISESLDLTQAKVGEVVERNLVLIPLKIRTPIRLNNIFFKSDEAVLLNESRAELNRLASLLRSYKTMEIEISGHTDSQNTPQYNQKLSESRAAAVVDYLVQAGIAASRLQSKGFGETRPVASNDTREGRQLNRRVEFIILKME